MKIMKIKKMRLFLLILMHNLKQFNNQTRIRNNLQSILYNLFMNSKKTNKIRIMQIISSKGKKKMLLFQRSFVRIDRLSITVDKNIYKVFFIKMETTLDLRIDFLFNKVIKNILINYQIILPSINKKILAATSAGNKILDLRFLIYEILFPISSN